MHPAVPTPCCPPRIRLLQRLRRGFTLIELMIVVLILSILAALAYPSYMEHLYKGYRAEGRAALMALLQEQERFFTQNNTYRAIGPGQSGWQAITQDAFMKNWSGDAGFAAASYRLKAMPCTGQTGVAACIRLEAHPAREKDTQVARLWIESTGGRGCTGTRSEECW